MPSRSFSFRLKQPWPFAARVAGYSCRSLAQFCDVSLRHLERHFREAYDMELRAWLRDLRMKDAACLLRCQRPIKSVAWLLAYKQVSHFCRDFKEFYGVTASSFPAAGSQIVQDTFFEHYYHSVLEDRRERAALLAEVNSSPAMRSGNTSAPSPAILTTIPPFQPEQISPAPRECVPAAI